MTTTVLGGRYRLGPEIGAGGTGSVHRARDEQDGRDVAVKLLRTGADATDCERLRREAEYLGQVQHPNLVAVLDTGADRVDGRGTAWFAMELVDGPDLRRLLRERGPMDGAAVRRLLGGVLAALGALHAAGLVHRDVTPANILLTAGPFARWEAKLTDLGIARRLLAEPLTGVGKVVGTPAYLSPEQVTGSPVGPAADVYAAALVAIESITGRAAFPGTATESAMARLVRRPALPEDLDPRWRAVLEAATAIDPGARPSVESLQEAVRALPDETGSDPERIGPAPVAGAAVTTARATAVQPAQGTAVLVAIPPPRGARRLVAAVSGALLLVALGAGGAAAVVHGAAVLAAQPGSEDGTASAPRATATPTASPAATAPVQQADPAQQAGPPAPPAGGPGGPAAGPGAGPP